MGFLLKIINPPKLRSGFLAEFIIFASPRTAIVYTSGETAYFRKQADMQARTARAA